MATKVEKVRAARDYPQFGILRGEEHYVWSLYRQRPQRSKVYPKPSQLTSSEFLQTAYQIEEMIEESECETAEDVAALRDTMVEQINELESEQQEKFDNMPEGLQQGDTGQLLQERIDSLQTWATELGCVDIETEDPGNTPDIENLKEQLTNCNPGF